MNLPANASALRSAVVGFYGKDRNMGVYRSHADEQRWRFEKKGNCLSASMAYRLASEGAANRFNTMPSRFSRRNRCHSSSFCPVVNAVWAYDKKITWNAGADWPGQYSANVRFRVIADDQPPTNSLTLFIGYSGSGAAAGTWTTLRVNLGSSFGLAWTNNLSPSQYPNGSTFSSCKGVWPAWDSAVVTNYGQINLVVPTNLAVGSYTFGIIWTSDPTNPIPQVPRNSTVTLNVISSGIREQ